MVEGKQCAVAYYIAAAGLIVTITTITLHGDFFLIVLWWLFCISVFVTPVKWKKLNRLHLCYSLAFECVESVIDNHNTT